MMLSPEHKENEAPRGSGPVQAAAAVFSPGGWTRVPLSPSVANLTPDKRGSPGGILKARSLGFERDAAGSPAARVPPRTKILRGAGESDELRVEVGRLRDLLQREASERQALAEFQKEELTAALTAEAELRAGWEAAVSEADELRESLDKNLRELSKARPQEMQRELDALRVQLAASKKEATTLRASLAASEKDATTTKSAVFELESELEVSRGSTDDLLAQLGASQRALAEAEARVGMNGDKLVECEAAITALTRDLAESRSWGEELQRKVVEDSSELMVRLEEAESEGEVEAARLRADLESARGEAEAEAARLRVAEGEARAEAARLREALEGAQREAASIAGERDALRARAEGAEAVAAEAEARGGDAAKLEALRGRVAEMRQVLGDVASVGRLFVQSMSKPGADAFAAAWPDVRDAAAGAAEGAGCEDMRGLWGAAVGVAEALVAGQREYSKLKCGSVATNKRLAALQSNLNKADAEVDTLDAQLTDVRAPNYKP
mmetsp:Transcript_17377/g.55796  ORF Transcript_17377/g.55796 Transcript_17377/m.55796 type:complete len:499 (+) Transcript_17377:757-2253(+)